MCLLSRHRSALFPDWSLEGSFGSPNSCKRAEIIFASARDPQPYLVNLRVGTFTTLSLPPESVLRLGLTEVGPEYIFILPALRNVMELLLFRSPPSRTIIRSSKLST